MPRHPWPRQLTEESLFGTYSLRRLESMAIQASPEWRLLKKLRVSQSSKGFHLRLHLHSCCLWNFFSTWCFTTEERGRGRRGEERGAGEMARHEHKFFPYTYILALLVIPISKLQTVLTYLSIILKCICVHAHECVHVDKCTWAQAPEEGVKCPGPCSWSYRQLWAVQCGCWKWNVGLWESSKGS